MEAIDHGPLFIKQLVACLLRYVAHQDDQQGVHSDSNTTTAALAAAAASGTAAVHAHDAHRELPASHAGHGLVAADAAPGSTRAAGAAAATSGQSAIAASGEGGVEARAAKGLESWSRVPTAPTDGTLLDEALATAGKAFPQPVLLVCCQHRECGGCWCTVDMAHGAWESSYTGCVWHTCGDETLC